MEKQANIHGGHRKRQKEKFSKSGLDAFASHEALELLLYYALPRIDTNEVAHALLRRFGDLNGVFCAPLAELTQVPGVGENAAILLRLVPEIFRRSRVDLDVLGQKIETVEEAGAFLKKYFWGVNKEIVMELCLDGRYRVVACQKLSEGGLSSGEFNLRAAVHCALTNDARYVYLAHNHPSGIALPSPEDETATRVLQSALSAVGVHFLDHLVMAENDFTSMAASGMLSI